MRVLILLAGLFLVADAAHAVPFDRATVRLGRVQPLLALPSAEAAPATVPPQPPKRRERAA